MRYYDSMSVSDFILCRRKRFLEFIDSEVSRLGKFGVVDVGDRVLIVCRNNVYKLADEWYIVYIYFSNNDGSSVIYKCDQMEGLIKCLEDII